MGKKHFLAFRLLVFFCKIKRFGLSWIWQRHKQFLTWHSLVGILFIWFMFIRFEIVQQFEYLCVEIRLYSFFSFFLKMKAIYSIIHYDFLFLFWIDNFWLKNLFSFLFITLKKKSAQKKCETRTEFIKLFEIR